jgi:hypothetical protein
MDMLRGPITMGMACSRLAQGPARITKRRSAGVYAAGAERVFAEKVSGAVTDSQGPGPSSRGAERGGRVVGHSAGSTSALNQGPPERLGCGRQGWWGFGP